ncbi:pyridoxine/pyridoxamine 5'-phosphate oxidase [Kribbella aluminosa]|uniref:Pyridoxine/pyridoxamine 5'-phosphate oxidase n=1 Tax=Kribbella aluminosa TaxID=416017 RepID=A0ABS4UF94_9ACTN|nr:pyridoxamine 5'-phosphate oxidase family protein [Kribbella aluminosa]MBP2350283.1 pyridoxine/pyridoxamine 5'-phosphate oxidase [Kribbella aluminosa]
MTREEFVAFVRKAREGVVATVDADGSPEAALVGMAVTDAGDVLFDTYTATRKVDNIRVHERVALVIGWDDGVSVQVEGSAEILSGAERDACGTAYLEQFPGSRALVDGFSLVRVVPNWLRHYDARTDPAAVTEGNPW